MSHFVDLQNFWTAAYDIINIYFKVKKMKIVLYL